MEERIPGEESLQALASAQQRLAEFDASNQELEDIRLHLRENEVEQSRLTEINRQYRAQMNEAKTRMHALGETTALCPLCNQPLSETHRAHLLEDISREGQNMGDTFRSNTSQLQALADAQTAFRESIHTLELDLKLRPAQEQLVARLKQQLEQGEQAQERVLHLRQDALALEQKLKSEHYAIEERAALEHTLEELKQLQSQVEEQRYAPDTREALVLIADELAKVDYDAVYHNQVKSSIQALRMVEEKYRELETARAGSDREQALLARLIEDIGIEQQRRQVLENDRLQYQQSLTALQPILSKGTELARLLDENRKIAVTKRQLLGATKQNLAVLDTLEKRSVDFRGKKDEFSALCEHIHRTQGCLWR